MAQYQGHKNWNTWNVSLWINNDERLYRHALSCVRCYPRRQAAKTFVNWMRELGMDKTPDGAPFSTATVQSAMRGMK